MTAICFSNHCCESGCTCRNLYEPNDRLHPFRYLILHITSRKTPQEIIGIIISIIASMLYNISSAFDRTPAQVSRTAETRTGTITSWLSLITSPPIDPRCSDHLYDPDGEHHTMIAFDPRLEVVANMTCLPREAAEWYTQKNLPFGATTGTVTSLGPMSCPNGYTTASTRKKDLTSTMVFCCPSSYNFASSADHGNLYGCTSIQTRQVTVHQSGTTLPIRTLAAGVPPRAPEVAGVAVNGWIFKPSPLLSSTTPTATTNGDIWAKKHIGMTTAEFSGILLGGLAGIGLFLVALHFCITRKWFRRRARTDKGDHGPDNSTRASSVSDDEVGLNPTRDVELSDLNSSRTRVPSVADTVVRHMEHSQSKSEGSSTDEEMRTA